MTPEQRYARKIDDLIKRCGKLTDAQVKDVLKILGAARTEVAARIAETEWQAYQIPKLKEAVERAMDGFRQRYLADQKDSLKNMWNAGIDLVDAPLAEAGIMHVVGSLPEMPVEALEILQGYSADLIQGLSADAIKQINGEITLGILGEKTPFEVMRAIGRNLDDKSVFRNIAVRAETITRTEMGRVQSAAREARIEEVMKANPTLKWLKKWIASGKAHPRENHAALDGVMVPVDEDFPGGIPYPHAPGLPAGESINCGCSHVLTLDDWEQAGGGGKPEQYHPRAIYD